jgi:hypothetical protein
VLHVIISVGWLGVDFAMLAPGITGFTAMRRPRPRRLPYPRRTGAIVSAEASCRDHMHGLRHYPALLRYSR